MKIVRIKAYYPPKHNPTFNQSDLVVTVETDSGLIGVGEGGSIEMLRQCAQMLIGKDPRRIQDLWQLLYRGWFYPAGREKLHSLGALDLALWDLKGKALGAPVYELLGGLARDFVSCYSTGYPNKGSVEGTARACIAAGFRAFRTGAGDTSDGVFVPARAISQSVRVCEAARRGVGEDGEWAIDFHTRFEPSEAVRLCSLIEGFAPLFVEDPLRSENIDAMISLRDKIRVPIAVGEQYGDRWDINRLIEAHAIDFTRVTLPNTGGITEFVKVASLCETHYVGMVPHFTGPISVAALVHVLSALSIPALVEIPGDGSRTYPHISSGFHFENGKLWPVDQPGLGVEVDTAGLELALDVDTAYAPIPTYRRPDGSVTNW